MTDFKFCGFMEYDDGKMARLETMKSGIPVNVYAEEDTDFSLVHDDIVSLDVCAICREMTYYVNESEYAAAETVMGPVAMIPAGTFPVSSDDEDFEQSPHIIFSGRVMDVDADPDADENEPNYGVYVQTLDMELIVFLRYEGEIEVGGILSGTAWLYGDIVKKSDAAYK